MTKIRINSLQGNDKNYKYQTHILNHQYISKMNYHMLYTPLLGFFDGPIKQNNKM